MREPPPFRPERMPGEAIVRALNELIEMDRDAIGSYDSALKGLGDLPDVGQPLAGFRDDHDRHVRELSVFVRHYGGEPRSSGMGPLGLVTKASAELARLAGGPAIVGALARAERSAVETYQRGLRHPWPLTIREAVERAAADDRRHLAWCEEAERRLGSRRA